MAEAVFNAAGLGLPIVMTVANRAIGAPINIWNDHSDSMSQRDCGWMQLYAADNQEAADLHVQAFRLAEELSLPVMVCMDGFVLTHAFEEVDLPEQEQVDAFLPPLRAAAGARPGPSRHDRRDGRAGGVHRGPLPGPPPAPRGSRPCSARSRLTSRLPSAGPAPASSAPTGAPTPPPSWSSLGSVQGTMADVVDERRDQGTAGRRPRHHQLPALPAPGGAGGARPLPGEWSCSSGRSSWAPSDRSPPTSVRHSPGARSRSLRRRRARRPPDHQGVPARHASTAPSEAELEPMTFLDLDQRGRRPRAGPTRPSPAVHVEVGS